jgi:hypothetical protein
VDHLFNVTVDAYVYYMDKLNEVMTILEVDSEMSYPVMSVLRMELKTDGCTRVEQHYCILHLHAAPH